MQRKKQKKLLLDALLNELSNLQKNAELLEKNIAYIRPYPLPIWKGAVESGHLQCLSDMTAFTLLLEVFSYIEDANRIEMKGFELINGSVSNHFDFVFSEVQKVREEVKEQIKQGISIIQNQ